MVNLKNSLVLMLFLVLLILISGCKAKDDTKRSVEQLESGTEGLIVNFLSNNPPSVVYVDEISSNIDVVMELKNKGAYPQPDSDEKLEGKLYLSGYDKDIIPFEGLPFDLGTLALYGKSIINLEGGSDLVSRKGIVDIGKLKVDKYEPTFLATACYKYFTEAGPAVCIDPDPYSTVKQKKVCEPHDITLSSQGAPIAVTKIDEEAFARKTQFKITVKNVGSGDVFRGGASSGVSGAQQSPNDFEKCNPFGSNKITRDDINMAYLEEVSVGDEPLQCWPFANEPVKAGNGYIRLINGEGSIICELEKKDQDGYAGGNTAYTTPLKIRLSYLYKTTAERKVTIKTEDSAR